MTTEPVVVVRRHLLSLLCGDTPPCSASPEGRELAQAITMLAEHGHLTVEERLLRFATLGACAVDELRKSQISVGVLSTTLSRMTGGPGSTPAPKE